MLLGLTPSLTVMEAIESIKKLNKKSKPRNSVSVAVRSPFKKISEYLTGASLWDIMDCQLTAALLHLADTGHHERVIKQHWISRCFLKEFHYDMIVHNRSPKDPKIVAYDSLRDEYFLQEESMFIHMDGRFEDGLEKLFSVLESQFVQVRVMTRYGDPSRANLASVFLFIISLMARMPDHEKGFEDQILTVNDFLNFYQKTRDRFPNLKYLRVVDNISDYYEFDPYDFGRHYRNPRSEKRIFYAPISADQLLIASDSEFDEDDVEKITESAGKWIRRAAHSKKRVLYGSIQDID